MVEEEDGLAVNNYKVALIKKPLTACTRLMCQAAADSKMSHTGHGIGDNAGAGVHLNTVNNILEFLTFAISIQRR